MKNNTVCGYNRLNRRKLKHSPEKSGVCLNNQGDKNMKKALSIIMCLLMLLTIALPVTATAEETDFNLYYTYSDIQVNKTSADQRYGTNNNHIGWQPLYSVNGGRGVYLAQNELEGFQVVFYERGEGRTLDIDFTPFVNENGEVLECNVYNEIFLSPVKVTSYKLADALVPYDHEGVQTVTNENNAFFLELHSTKDQTPGYYVSYITVRDETGALHTQKVTAVVWNFALPEGHLSTYLVGNYNSGSGYYTTSGFLRLAGIRFDNNGIVEEDVERAEEILEAYDEFFLENGITPYEIPAYLIEKDAKEAELAMADTRRSMFMIPLTSHATNGTTFTNASTLRTINEYKSLVIGNKYLEDKAFFYPADEPSWKTEEAASGYLSTVNAIRNTWGENYHSIVPFGSDSYDTYAFSVIKDTTDILCMNQFTCAANTTSQDTASKQAYRAELSSDSWHKTLRYQGDTWNGNTYIYNWARSTKGVFVRVLQWQASALNSDGMLHWNGLFVPNNEDGTPYDVFENNEVFGPAGPSTGSGDGLYVYSGVSLGLDATTPVASLRLKQIQSGMDDYDYLSMVKEFLGEEKYTECMNNFLRNYAEGGTDQIWYCERNEGNGWDGDWITWEVVTLNNARVAMGNALSEANTEHEYGEWDVAVACDETHNGLAIRECANCGAKESKAVSACEEYDHIYEIKTNDKDTHKEVCKLCGDTKTAAHTSQTVEAVAPTCVNDGMESGTVCGICGEILTAQGVVPALGHEWDNGTVTTLPTCKAEGVKTFNCTRSGCDETKTEAVAKTAHSYADAKTAPTCTDKGYTTHTCTVCGDTYKDNEVGATGHTDNNGDGICDECNSSTCSCSCHNAKPGLLWKIKMFFWKLFKIASHKTCECGKAHY